MQEALPGGQSHTEVTEVLRLQMHQIKGPSVTIFFPKRGHWMTDQKKKRGGHGCETAQNP